MLASGTIIFDPNFQFHDGKTGRKIFIVLACAEDNSALVVKTTSNGKRYCLEFGCQHRNRFPCFHLPLHSCCLTDPTWVCLHEFYEFRLDQLIQKAMTGQVNKIGLLPQEITRDLLICSRDSSDIMYKHEILISSIIG